MIKIDEVFTAKRYNRGWELHETRPTTNKKSKTGFSTDVTFYGSLKFLAMAVIEKSAGECKTGNDLLEHINSTETRLFDRLDGVK